jgi:hypothetical protein
MRHVDGYQRESQDAWNEYVERIRECNRGEHVDSDMLLDPLRRYIDARIKLAFAEKIEYGKVVL